MEEQRLEIKYGIDANLNPFWECSINGKEMAPHLASQMLTGTIDEDSEGVFTDSDSVWFRAAPDISKRFEFGRLPSIERSTDDVGEYRLAVVERIRAVREWIRNLPFEREVVIYIKMGWVQI